MQVIQMLDGHRIAVLEEVNMLYIKIRNIVDNIKSLFKDQSYYVSKKLHDYLHDYKYEIDNTTFDDLLLSEYNERFNHTVTSCGDEVFYHWLRSIKDHDGIKILQGDLKTIDQNKDTDLVSNFFSKVGKQKRGDIISDIWDGFTIKSKIIDNFYVLLAINVLLSVTISILNIKFIPLSIIFFCFFNFIIYILTNGKISRVSGSINYILMLCNALKKIDRKTELQLSIEIPKYKEFNRLSRYVIFFKDGIGGPESGDMLSLFVDYLRVFLCFEIYAFKRTSSFVIENLDEMHKIVYFVGYLDCLISSKKTMNEYQTVYTQINSQKGVFFDEMIHPLLPNSVSQTKQIRSGLIITGLNMSGKTTFMKSLAINQLLATSFGFCFAKNFSTNSLNIISSFRINDDMLHGKSRYYAEAYRLLEINNQIRTTDSLCLIDEILSGTNSDDRIYGASVILKDFSSNKNSIVVAATHDNKIAESLSEILTPVYFDGEINGDQIDFDYVIKEGIVSKRNGLLILKLIGLQNIEEIV
jgi:hypothetical protein